MDVDVIRADKPGSLEKVGKRVRKKVAPGELIREEEPLPAVGTRVRVAVRVLLNGRPAPLSAEVALVVRPSLDAPTAVTARSSVLGVVVEWSGVLPPKPSPSPSPVASPRPAGSPAIPTSPTTNPPSPPTLPTAPATPAPAAPPSPAPDASASPSPSPGPPGADPKAPEAKPTPPPPPTSGFWVYRRSREGGAYARPLSPNPVETQAFEDTTAKPGDHWCYAIRTVVSTDPPIESADSNEACVEVKDMAPPAAPTGLTAIVRDNVVELSWSPSPEPDVSSYRVYRAPAGGPLRCVVDNRLADVPAGETSYKDGQLRTGTAYLYAVAARDRGGNESPCSVEAEGGIQ
jgi:hypothetical protein